MYSATKHAVVGWTEAMNKELGPQGIKSTALCPAFVDTPMTDFVKEQVKAEEMIRPQDIAESVRFLLRVSPACVVPERCSFVPATPFSGYPPTTERKLPVMKLGVHIGYWGLGLSSQDQLNIVQEAERLGYDSVWTAEAYGSDSATILGWLAGQTSTIRLGAGIFQMPGRSPAMTAMTAATIDQLSDGA